jgi:hypothetical protein
MQRYRLARLHGVALTYHRDFLQVVVQSVQALNMTK